MADAEHGQPSTCLNCAREDPGRFCPDCGQRQGPLFTSVGEWLGEVFDELFAIDAKLPRSLRKLLWPPGELTLEWRRGRRVRYVAPFRLYLATAFPFFLAWPFTPFSTVLQSSAAGFMEGLADGQGQVGQMALQGDHRFEVAVQVLTDNLPSLAMVLFVPVFAGLLFAVTQGNGRYVGNLITAFHIHTLGFLAMILTVPVNLLFGSDTGQVAALALLLGLLAYVVIAIRRIYQTTVLGAFVRTVTVTSVYLFLAILFIGGSVSVLSVML
jgi:hypothetical protein